MAKRTERHKIGELRELLRLMGGRIHPHGYERSKHICAHDEGRYLGFHADHIVCAARRELRRRGVDVRWYWSEDDSGPRWMWVQINGNDCDGHFKTELAAIADALRAIGGAK